MAFDEYTLDDPGVPFVIENLQMGASHAVGNRKNVTIPEWAHIVDIQARDGDVRIYASSDGTKYWTLGAGKPESFSGQLFRSGKLYCSGAATTVYLEVRVSGALS